MKLCQSVNISFIWKLECQSKKTNFICRVRKESCIGATSAKRQRLFSPAIRKSLPNKENNAMSRYHVVPRVPDDGKPSQCIGVEGFLRYFQDTRGESARAAALTKRQNRYGTCERADTYIFMVPFGPKLVLITS